MTWYVAETQWRMEREVCERLSPIPTMLPLISENGRILPMFLCYVFVQSQAREVRGCRGIRQLLGAPTPLPKLVAERMKDLCNTVSTVEEVLPALVPIGANVKLTGGPMMGLTARVLRSNRARVGLLLSVLGRDIEIQVPTQLVAAA